VSDFAALAGVTCPSHEALLLALSTALGSSPEPAEPALRRLAGRLPAPASAAEDLAAVAALLRAELRPSPDGPLLLSDALAAGRAHPLAAAAAAVAAAGRRGLAVELVGNNELVWIAHTHRGCRLVVDPRRPWGAFDASALGVDLRWRCAHQIAFLTLERIELRALDEGDGRRLREAAGLMAALPLEYRAMADRP
jgi:hypothetical protein